MEKPVSAKRAFLNKTKEELYREIKNYSKTLAPTKALQGYPASALVGEKHYPFVQTHSVSTEEKEDNYQNNAQLVKKSYAEIIRFKAKHLLASSQQNPVQNIKTSLLDELQTIYKGKRPVQMETTFAKEIQFNKIFVSKVAGLSGAQNPIADLKASENSPTSKLLEKFTQEDIKAREAMLSLYRKGVNETQIIELLSLGSFGINSNRRLVPSRWAISAYDKAIDQDLYKNVRRHRTINSYEVYAIEDKGNFFLILFFPFSYEAEIIEAFSHTIEQDYVKNDNILHKKEPATAGGFYATKLAMLEHLEKRQRSAACLSLRIIDGYDLPLGVVLVRELVREALKNRPQCFSSEKELFSYIKERYASHYKLLSHSDLLKEKRTQKTLRDFFG
ncbi:hypothetical protein H6501_03425 [Candidatus Woesearchaeota archaeon]|nr:hypothetical protein [Nanoarchaeota archaeon]MCB9370620.1 hypothetical protein [Candidatus Woesearchaeota archaeon]USN43704.1 MAG: hypothetical protein H6500_04925 [Candidatus Woesearchaeota archaeon]